MKQKIQLLPHWCQVIGYTYLYLFLLSCLIVYLFTIPDALTPISQFIFDHWKIIGTVNLVMTALAIFSQEKIEDEMTRSIRIKVLIAWVIFLFLFQMTLYMPRDTAVGETVRTLWNFLTGDFGILVLVYAILYKLAIWINCWRNRNEE